MEFILSLPLLIIPFVLPFAAGQMAIGFGRKFWPWFFAGLILPFIAHIILLCLPDKKKNKSGLKLAENNDLFNHFLENGNTKKNIKAY